MDSNNIVLVGYYGYNNLGDDLLLLSTLKILDETGFKGEVFIPSPKGLNQLIAERSFGYRITRIPRYNPFILEKAIKRSSLTIFGGGNLFQDETSTRSFLYYYFVARKTLSYRKRLLLLSQGFGPLKKGMHSKKLSEILSNENCYAILRDTVSFRFASDYSSKAFEGTDYGPYCLDQSEETAQKDKKLAILVPKHFNTANEILKVLIKKDFRRISIIPFQNHRETKMYEKLCRIARSMGFYIISAPQGQISTAKLFQHSRLIVSERLHGAILAMWMAKPFIWKSSEKMEGFFSSFEYIPPSFSEDTESIDIAIARSTSFDYNFLSKAYVQRLERTVLLSKEIISNLLWKR
ncbi:hypothetical protein AT15_07255 [Kosmotoga arenicorallina S304]|uniref:Polysaccharide pyruvyl transferase domain-containing protein n=1 Tax=Kosmotoga arenicorallina S304 TaxID=1453497 RepID=A0A176K259_9BACT|nr:polysaccharide pyruvyl transferase family protein [Kosmotoga arenicorallina]OAA31286.1 hypothetical protein AT15_07255 [Kosmotoga arenicorallina S304]